MHKISISILLLTLSLCLSGDVVENPDKPLQGEWDFALHKVWELNGAGEDVFVQANTIRVDDEGRVYVLELKLSKIFVFDKDGNFLYAFGKKGEGPGEVRMAYTFFLVGDKVIIPDMGKINYFDKKGTYIESKIAGSMVFPRFFLDEKSFIYVKETREAKRSSDRLEIINLDTKQG